MIAQSCEAAVIVMDFTHTAAIPGRTRHALPAPRRSAASNTTKHTRRNRRREGHVPRLDARRAPTRKFVSAALISSPMKGEDRSQLRAKPSLPHWRCCQQRHCLSETSRCTSAEVSGYCGGRQNLHFVFWSLESLLESLLSDNPSLRGLPLRLLAQHFSMLALSLSCLWTFLAQLR